MLTAEDRAWEKIDEALEQAWWKVQDAKKANLAAGRGVALRNFALTSGCGYGFADYLLYLDGKAAGVIEAKKEGVTLTGVEIQSAKYSEGLPPQLPAYVRPLPFLYQSTGIETRFTNGLDPEPRSRRVFSFHKPDTLAEPCLSVIDEPEATVEANLTRADRLRQAILTKAFSGELIGSEEPPKHKSPHEE